MIFHKNDADNLNLKDKKYSPITEGNEAKNPGAGRSSANSSYANLLDIKLKSDYEP